MKFIQGFVKSKKARNISISTLFILLGLALIFWPNASIRAVSRLVGIALIISAVVCGLYAYRADKSIENGTKILGRWGLCILSVIGALIVLALPNIVENVVPRVIGILLMINGGVNLYQTFQLRQSQNGKWNIALILSILTILCSLIIFFNAIHTANLVIRAIGLFLVYNGASNIWVNTKFDSDMNVIDMEETE